MNPTDTIMARLVEIAAGFDRLDQSNEASLLKDILALRTAYSSEVAKLFGALASDERLKAHPEIAEEFGRRFLATRHAVADLQARWRMHQIEAEPKRYLGDIKQVVALSDDMLRWGIAALKAAA